MTTYNVTVFEEVIGATIKSIEHNAEIMHLEFVDGRHYMMYHSQDCCESVEIIDIVGDLQDLIGSPLLEAEEVSFTPKDDIPDASVVGLTYNVNTDESVTWTFYKFGTMKGAVNIRWLGTSNGYYSEEVSFNEVKPDKLDRYLSRLS